MEANLAVCRGRDVPGAGGQEIGHVETGAAPEKARHPLLQQQPLQQLPLRLVRRPGDAPSERSSVH